MYALAGWDGQQVQRRLNKVNYYLLIVLACLTSIAGLGIILLSLAYKVANEYEYVNVWKGVLPGVFIMFILPALFLALANSKFRH